MNIALWIPSLGGGGAERVAQRIGDYYVKRGEKVYYFLGDFGIKNDYTVMGEVIYTGIKPIDSEEPYGRWFSRIRAIKSILHMRALKKKYKINISISFMEDFNYLNVLSRVNEKVIVRICTILSECEEYYGRFLYQKNWIKKVYSRADKVIVMSQFGYHEMHDIYGIPKERIMIIPNPTIEKFVEDKKDKNWIYGKDAVITIGRLSPEKQQDRIIRAFCHVAERNPEACLIILGKGPLDWYLKTLCKMYGLEKRVFFVGFTKQVAYYCQNARVFVMTSKVEGFPNAMIEAMTYGTPVVATDSPGGIRDIVIDGKNRYGILTSPMPRGKVRPKEELTKEEISFGEEILSVLESDDLYEELHQHSLRRSKDFSMDKVMGLWDCLINEE